MFYLPHFPLSTSSSSSSSFTTTAITIAATSLRCCEGPPFDVTWPSYRCGTSK